MPNSTNRHHELFLPNLCGIRAVFFVVLIAELFAFLLVLVPTEMPLVQRWKLLGLVSLFIQWCALLSCAALCLLRNWLSQFSNVKTGIISYVLILVIIGLVSELTYLFVLARHTPSLHHHLTFLIRNLVMGAILVGPVLRYFYIQNQWRRNVRAETEARLQALQSRIRPHFLFNSMNTIASLTRSHPEQAEMAVENLADLFRVTLRDAKQQIRLDEEIELCQRYLEIEQLRLGDRLKIHWDLQVPDDALIPALMLQPLLENAIYHGIESRSDGGTIEIQGNLQSKLIEIRLINPLLQSNSQHQQGNKLAQANIRERLAAFYGHHASLETSISDDHYIVTLRLPYETTENENLDR